MTEQQHRATPQQWLAMEMDSQNFAAASTILELRDRIEALEMALQVATGTLTPAEQAKVGVVLPASSLSAAVNQAASEAFRAASTWVDDVDAQPAKPNHPEIPDGSLVERVGAVIDNSTACDRDSERIARDVIRAVAAWLLKHYGGRTATTYLLEQEAER